MILKLFAIAFALLVLISSISIQNVSAQPEVIKRKLTEPCGSMPFGGEEVGSLEIKKTRRGTTDWLEYLKIEMKEPPSKGEYIVGFMNVESRPSKLPEALVKVDEYRDDGKVMILQDKPLPPFNDVLVVAERAPEDSDIGWTSVDVVGSSYLVPPESFEPTELEYGKARIIHALDVVKNEYNIGEKVELRPKLINIGSENVKIIHGSPLFIVDAYDASGNAVWVNSKIILTIGIPAELEPIVPYGGMEYNVQEVYEITFCKPGEYKIVSSAYFSIEEKGAIPDSLKIYSEPVRIKVDPSGTKREWETSYMVGKFLYSKPPKLDQLFKVQYRVINGIVEQFTVYDWTFWPGSVGARVNSDSDGILKIKFPRNYPYYIDVLGQDRNVNGTNASVSVNGEDSIFGNIIFEKEITDCFFVFSIPFTRSNEIRLGWTGPPVGAPHRGDNIPYSCIPETLVDVPVRTDGTISPLHQFWAGVKTEDIVCKEGFELVIRSDGKPYCMTPSTAERLADLWK